jgi:hypothetical protein
VSDVSGAPQADGLSSANGVERIGVVAHPLRNGSHFLELHWEAIRLPAKVCEGGGWYSAHPTERRWSFRSWMAHKSRPGWAWPKISDRYESDPDAPLSALACAAVDDAKRRYPAATPVQPAASSPQGRHIEPTSDEAGRAQGNSL